jgi:hypothetical protein
MRGHSTRSEDQIPEDRRPKGQAGHERREEEADVLVEDALLRLAGEDEDRFAYDAEKSGDGVGIYAMMPQETSRPMRSTPSSPASMIPLFWNGKRRSRISSST